VKKDFIAPFLLRPKLAVPRESGAGRTGATRLREAVHVVTSALVTGGNGVDCVDRVGGASAGGIEGAHRHEAQIRSFLAGAEQVVPSRVGSAGLVG